MDIALIVRAALRMAKEKGIGKGEIAKIAGVHPMTINKWLSGATSPTWVCLTAVVNACGYQLKVTMS